MADLKQMDTAVNCCNGRVGRRLMELASEDDKIARLVMPTGIEILKEAAKVGLAARESVNCCNGRVGRAMNLQEIIKDLGAGGQE